MNDGDLRWCMWNWHYVSLSGTHRNHPWLPDLSCKSLTGRMGISPSPWFLVTCSQESLSFLYGRYRSLNISMDAGACPSWCLTPVLTPKNPPEHRPPQSKPPPLPQTPAAPTLLAPLSQVCMAPGANNLSSKGGVEDPRNLKKMSPPIALSPLSPLWKISWSSWAIVGELQWEGGD